MISCMVDSGATHSFATKAVAEAVGWRVKTTYTLVVTLADGSNVRTTDAVCLSLGV